MTITNVEYAIYQGYPEVRFFWNGRPATVSAADLKRTLLDEGLVALGPAAFWEEELPEIVLPADPDAGQARAVLRGFTRDEDVIAVVRDFVEVCDRDTFEPGLILDS